jgi:replication factor C subunit 3/5
MRKVLNILESCALAYKNIPTSKIYEVTGRPSVQDIDQIYGSLTSATYKNAFETFMNIKTEKSLSLDDILRDLHKQVMETKFTENMKMFLVCRLSEIEYRLAKGANEKVQVASVVGAFIEVRNIK